MVIKWYISLGLTRKQSHLCFSRRGDVIQELETKLLEGWRRVVRKPWLPNEG